MTAKRERCLFAAALWHCCPFTVMDKRENHLFKSGCQCGRSYLLTFNFAARQSGSWRHLILRWNRKRTTSKSNTKCTRTSEAATRKRRMLQATIRRRLPCWHLRKCRRQLVVTNVDSWLMIPTFGCFLATLVTLYVWGFWTRLFSDSFCYLCINDFVYAVAVSVQ